MTPKTIGPITANIPLVAEAWWELLRAMVRVRVSAGRARWLSEALCLPPSVSLADAPLVTLSAAKGLDSMLKRFFAALRMTKANPLVTLSAAKGLDSMLKRF